MLSYGDGLADIDINRLLAFHREHGKIATVTTVTPTSRFGIVEMTGNGRISRVSRSGQKTLVFCSLQPFTHPLPGGFGGEPY
jgi:glucose-1-phosphate cytidylyltransferase